MTLIELLVVLAIIGVMISLLLPAVQQARAAARGLACRNNLRQLALATHQYEMTHRVLPPSFMLRPGIVQRGSWSVHGRILPFIEQQPAYRQVRLDRDWHAQVNTGVPPLRIPLYLCPSDPNTRVRMRDGRAYVHPTSFGFNMGDWLIHDPIRRRGGGGAFRVARGVALAEVLDGTSNTLCAADVLAYTPYLRNTSTAPSRRPTSPSFAAAHVGELKLGRAQAQNTGHTVWTDGRVHHTGFTTTFPPNTLTSYTVAGQTYDIDFTSQQEGRSLTRPTFAAVTSRSRHPHSVNVSLLDGSTRAVGNSIDAEVWRRMGTIDD